MVAGKVREQATPVACPVTGTEIISAEIEAQSKGTLPLIVEKKIHTVLVASNAWVGDFVDKEFTKWYEV